MSLSEQTAWLFLLAIPIGCVSWTVTHEELFREPRERCKECSEQARTLVRRKFFYVFTCEYCLSHYVALAFLIITRFRLLFTDWRGYLLALFALVFVANFYMNVYARLRLNVTQDRIEIKAQEKKLSERKAA